MKILTIGTSIITSRFIQAVSTLQHSKICAVYSRDLSKATALAHPLNAVAYDNLEQALSDSKIDTVYVASVNSLHYEHAMLAIHNNKHVIIEKPVTSDEDEFLSILALASSKNVFVFEAITTLHLPNFGWVQSHLSVIGAIKQVTTNYHQLSSKYYSYINGDVANVFDLQQSGGSLVDLNVYNLHFILALFGDPESANYTPIRGFNGVDVSGVALLKYNNFIAIASASKSFDGEHNFLIEGEYGSISCNSAVNKLMKCTLKIRDVTLESLVDNTENVLNHELAVFEKCILKQDVVTVSALNESSKRVIYWMSKMRRNAGIYFKGENHETLFEN